MTKARDLANIISGGFTADDIPNIDASKITSGTFADARISNSSVVQHSTPFDDNKIVNDLSTLALRQASDQNKSAYNTNSQSVDVFQDDTGIDTTTNTIRNSDEYVRAATLQNVNETVTLNSSNYTTYVDTNKIAISKRTTSQNSDLEMRNDITGNGTFDGGSGTTDLQTMLGHVFGSPSSPTAYLLENNGDTTKLGFINFGFKSGYTFSPTNGGSFGWRWRNGSGSFSRFNLFGVGSDGLSDAELIEQITSVTSGNSYNYTINNSGSITDFYGLSLRVLHSSSNSYMYDSVSIPGTFSYQEYQVNSTGNFTGTTITAPSSVSEMGAIITYQDATGTNALNTDIVLQLSADGGSNYSTATLTALPDFSTGIKMAKVNDLAVTAGTQLKYKISFANQASGSKEARIRGVALQY